MVRSLLILIALLPLTSFKAQSHITVPEIVLNITITEAAAIKLSQSGESISGVFYFDGPGTPYPPNRKTAPFRSVFLGSYRFEVMQAGEFRFTDAVISKEAYNRLSDKNYYFTLNIVSSRKAFEDNLLRGGFAAGRVEDFKLDRPINVNLSLLSER